MNMKRKRSTQVSFLTLEHTLSASPRFSFASMNWGLPSGFSKKNILHQVSEKDQQRRRVPLSLWFMALAVSSELEHHLSKGEGKRTRLRKKTKLTRLRTLLTQGSWGLSLQFRQFRQLLGRARLPGSYAESSKNAVFMGQYPRWSEKLRGDAPALQYPCSCK